MALCVVRSSRSGLGDARLVGHAPGQIKLTHLPNPPPQRAARRRRGVLQDVANQLAQMAVGWEVTFSGPALPVEPDAGIMEIDVASASSCVNGCSTDLSIARVLRSWLLQELRRKDLSTGWLRSASVTIHYSRSGPPPNLTASARVVSEWGEADGHSSNSQALPTPIPDGSQSAEG